MIIVNKKEDCCACGACAQICPKQCISFQNDNEGFAYAKANGNNCINCGLCEKVCPVLNHFEPRKPHNTLAAINKNEVIRISSSSGGIFYLLAEKTIKEKGVVFGARYDENWQVILDYADSLDKVRSFMGSKYVQASVGSCYKQCKLFLEEGRKVLFTGTPCQIAGLNLFLRKTYKNLLTVDFVCHGVPSPNIWSLYLDEIIGGDYTRIKDINFRNKQRGWKSFRLVVESSSSDSPIISESHSKNIYMKGFLNNLILRPSCYKCRVKSGCSHSDITIADFWGIQKVNPSMYDNKGTSMILCYTTKGVNYLNSCDFCYSESEYTLAIKMNPAIEKCSVCHPKRESFFSNFDLSYSLSQQLNRALYVPLIKRLADDCIRIVYNLFLSLRGALKRQTKLLNK